MAFSESKFTRMLNKLEDLCSWSGGVETEWTGMALLSPQDIADLAYLASFAPDHAIVQFEKDMCLTDLEELP